MEGLYAMADFPNGKCGCVFYSNEYVTVHLLHLLSPAEVDLTPDGNNAHHTFKERRLSSLRHKGRDDASSTKRVVFVNSF